MRSLSILHITKYSVLSVIIWWPVPKIHFSVQLGSEHRLVDTNLARSF